MMPRTRKSRPRPPRGRPAEPRRSNSAIAVDQREWVFMPTPAIVDKALFTAAQEQLRENRTRARMGLREAGSSSSRVDLLRPLRICVLRKDDSPKRERPPYEGVPVLSVLRDGSLPVRRRVH